MVAITYMDLATTLPFENSIDTYEFPGQYLKDLFERAVEVSWQSNDQLDMTFLTQVSGIFTSCSCELRFFRIKIKFM